MYIIIIGSGWGFHTYWSLGGVFRGLFRIDDRGIVLGLCIDDSMACLFLGVYKYFLDLMKRCEDVGCGSLR